ncbi:glycosaminoglycan xylosylkinase-like [Styela clava]
MKLKARIVLAVIIFTLIVMTINFSKYSHRSKEQVRLQLIGKESKNANPNLVNVNEFEVNLKPPNLNEGTKEQFIESELRRLQIDVRSAASNFKNWPWQIAASWVNKRQIYPENHPELATILYAMSTARIIEADVLPKGTQLKLLFILDGGQKVVFKQKRYERDHVIDGKPYDGFDRHNGEIASFHLDRVFNFRRSPITVGRIVNLRDEVLTVATDRLKKTFLEKDGNLCYFGVCYYCKESEKACAAGDIMEGAVTLWLPEEYSTFEKLRHPYQRTYVEGRSAKWEKDETYCDTVVKHKPPYDRGARLLDIADACAFDYLIGNADRHHYEVFKNKGKDVMLIMMDNAKSFGNPYFHEQSILAPLRQCCILRNSTWLKLHRFKDGVLTKLLEAAMENDPISPVLHHSHFKAMNERLPHLLSTIDHCIKERGKDNVILNEWKGVKGKT